MQCHSISWALHAEVDHNSIPEQTFPTETLRESGKCADAALEDGDTASLPCDSWRPGSRSLLHFLRLSADVNSSEVEMIARPLTKSSRTTHIEPSKQRDEQRGLPGLVKCVDLIGQ